MRWLDNRILKEEMAVSVGFVLNVVRTVTEPSRSVPTPVW